LISDFSIEIDNIPIKGGKFNYEEELNKFLTNNSLDRITPIADINNSDTCTNISLVSEIQ
jgi:hypothetical protein